MCRSIHMDTTEKGVNGMVSTISSRVKALIGRRRSPRPVAGAPAVFDEVAFRARERFRANYKTICTVLCDLVRFDSVLDIGCANGFLMDPMLTAGKDVLGVELSAAVLPLLSLPLRERVRIGDATRLGKIGDFDLVTCIEVAEHVEPDRSGPLVDVIVSNARRWVYFTAAAPYQAGHGHINCRPPFFWMNEFRKRGFALEWGLTERFVEDLGDLQPAEWLPKNSLLFSRQ